MTKINMASIVERNDVNSCLGPFKVLRDYYAFYPKAVINALCALYIEYNSAFSSLVERNMESVKDYSYCRNCHGQWINHGVQIDMVGLGQEFLDRLVGLPENQIKEILRRHIFEIENSLAMYPVLQELFSWEKLESSFKKNFRRFLDGLRQQYQMPIALLAVTDEKYLAIKATEFGRQANEDLLNEDVFRLSGFNRLFSPAQFQEYMQHNERCGYLLYVRSSEPVSKLKKPDIVVTHPLLNDQCLRLTIRQNSLTFNVDDPSWKPGDLRRINDTKRYMPIMDMALEIQKDENLRSVVCAEFLSRFRKNILDCSDIVHCKPIQGTYGCYGHVFGRVDNGDFLGQVRRRIRKYGPMLVQAQLPNSGMIANDGRRFAFIDRNFFAIINGKPEFLGGFRDFMSIESQEAKGFRIHGSKDSIWGEVVAQPDD